MTKRLQDLLPHEGGVRSPAAAAHRATVQQLRDANTFVVDMFDQVSASTIFQSLKSGLVVTDPRLPDNPIVRVNPAFCAMTGYTAEEVLGRNCRFMQGSGTDPVVVAEIGEAIRSGSAIRRTLLNYRRDGSSFWNELTLSPIIDRSGDLVGFAGIQTDVTDVIRDQEELQVLEARLQAVSANMPGYIFQRHVKSDGSWEYLYCSPSLGRLLGYPDKVLTFEEFMDHVHPDDLPMIRGALEVASTIRMRSSITFRMIAKDDREVWIRSVAVPRTEPGGRTVWDGCGFDITAERRAEERLAYLTCHDPLTGLENLTGFEGHVGAAIGRAPGGDRRAVVIVLTLPELAETRGALGPDLADSLLVAFAQRLRGFVGPEARIARLGDEKFAVLVSLSAPEARQSARALHAALDRPLEVHDRQIALSAEMGVAISVRDGLPSESSHMAHARELIMRAEIALGEYRRNGVGEPGFYSEDIDARASKRVILRQSMRQALTQEDFEVRYQPLVDLSQGRIVGAEALLRWTHPELGPQRPDEFIPLAEESGLIIPLGEWVLKRSMEQAARWDRPELGRPTIAVNVSGVQLKRSDFVSTVNNLLAATGVDPSRIELELTEGFLIGTSESVIETLMQIRRLGVGLAIDDFGTGYASYQYLKRLPIDKLKIDQAFVRQLAEDTADASIVRAIIAMARSLELAVHCEGIETQLQRDFVLQEGCRLGQGYFFAPAVPPAEFEALLQRQENGINPCPDNAFCR